MLERQSKHGIRVGQTVKILYPCWTQSKHRIRVMLDTLTIKTVSVLDSQPKHCIGVGQSIKHRIRVGQSKRCIRDGQTGKSVLDRQNCIRVGQTVETVSVSVGQPKLYPIETVSVLDRLSKLYPFLETMKTCWTDSRNCIRVGQTVEIP